MAQIGVRSNLTTSSSITCYVYGLDQTYTKSDRIIYWHANNVFIGTLKLGARVSYSNNFTFNGLSSGTTYTIKATIYYDQDVDGNYLNNLVLYTNAQTLTGSYTISVYESSYGNTYASVGSDSGTSLSATSGTKVWLYANPYSGYKFSSWYISPTNITLYTYSDTSAYFIMPAANVTVMAIYVASTYTATASSNPSAGGNTYVSYGSDSGSSLDIAYGETVQVTANPNSGYKFSSWTVSPTSVTLTTVSSSSTATIVSFTMPSQAVSITANYVKVTYSATVSSNNSSYGNTYLTSDGDSGESLMIAAGTTVHVYADPSTGYKFSKWEIITPTNLTLTTISSGDPTIASFTMPSQAVSIKAYYTTNRPAYFSWTYDKSSGGSFNLTATEWNNLCSNINAVRVYKGLSVYSFTTASSGNIFYASMYNEAVDAIQGISGYGAYLSTVSSNSIIYASQMNSLVSELNAIP